MSRAALGTRDVEGGIIAVSRTAEDASNAASDLLRAASDLSLRAEELLGSTRRFIDVVRA